MHATDLLRDSDELELPDVERWIAAALAEARALQAYDDRLYPLVDDPALMDRARRIHAAVGAWASATAAVVRRIEADPAFAHTYVTGLRDLRMAVLRGFATVSMTPEESLRRTRGVENGEGTTYHSMEDLRLELGLPLKSRRSA